MVQLRARLPMCVRALLAVMRSLPDHAIHQLDELRSTLFGLLQRCLVDGRPGAVSPSALPFWRLQHGEHACGSHADSRSESRSHDLQATRADSSESGPMANGGADAAKDTPMEVREVLLMATCSLLEALAASGPVSTTHIYILKSVLPNWGTHMMLRNMLQDASKADDDPAQSAAESTHAASPIGRVGQTYPAYTPASGSLLPYCAHDNVSLTCIFVPLIDFPAPPSLHMMPCLLGVSQMPRQWS